MSKIIDTKKIIMNKIEVSKKDDNALEQKLTVFTGF